MELCIARIKLPIGGALLAGDNEVARKEVDNCMPKYLSSEREDRVEARSQDGCRVPSQV